MDKTTLNAALDALANFFEGKMKSASLEYVYGYMDALAVIRELGEVNRPLVRMACGTVRVEA